MASNTISATGGHPSGTGSTLREDTWWLAPGVTFLGLGAFIVYATWAAFQGEHDYQSHVQVGERHPEQARPTSTTPRLRRASARISWRSIRTISRR